MNGIFVISLLILATAFVMLAFFLIDHALDERSDRKYREADAQEALDAYAKVVEQRRADLRRAQGKQDQ